jgi:hypothetical protein
MVSSLLFLYTYSPIIISQISSFYVEHGVLIPAFFIFLSFIFFQQGKYPSFSVHISLLLFISLLPFILSFINTAGLFYGLQKAH